MLINDKIPGIDKWKRELGLLPVPLYNTSYKPRYVLLNGTQGNFCLDFDDAQNARSLAWSSNVGHYVVTKTDTVEVQRWDQSDSSLQKFKAESVYKDLRKFYSYLEETSPNRGVSVVGHIIDKFRQLRAIMEPSRDAGSTLRAFLVMIACVHDKTSPEKLDHDSWGLVPEAINIASSINDADWDRLIQGLVQGRPSEGLLPDITLVLRHSAGYLFQEAHYEIISPNTKQGRFAGIEPQPAKVSMKSKYVGVHFTPPSLARTLCEEALRLNTNMDSLTIFDPACGSGEFLRESLRQLDVLNYRGTIRLIGWDISEAACDMAKCILFWERKCKQAKVEVEVFCKNSLLQQDWPTNVDIVLMNPPFQSWQDMSSEQKTVLSGALGKYIKNRPDLSFGFLFKSVSCLKSGGIIGTIIPASFLDSSSAKDVRKWLSERISPRLIARLGSQLLFPGTIIDTALYVGQAVDNIDDNKPTLAFWADFRQRSTSNGLRELRRSHEFGGSNVFPINGDGFSIFMTTEIGHKENSWTPRSISAMKALDRSKSLPKVGEIFNVRQGVRTGLKNAFVLPKDSYDLLPLAERSYFRPSVMNRSIVNGWLRETDYVFFPYGAHEIDSEEMLRTKVSVYYEKYLASNKGKLLLRSNISKVKWWQLSRNVDWQIKVCPKLVSTYFGDTGSFAFDEVGKYVVVQGQAWIPKRAQSTVEISTAYLAVLNSSIFSQLLAGVSSNVSGGQWNLSKKFVDLIPIPDFFSIDFRDSSVFRELSLLGRRIMVGQSCDQKQIDELTHRYYYKD